MWLFLLRSAMEMASSSLPSRSAPATCCTKTRDCLRAALYIRARSIITPSDHADRINRMNTTALAMMLMLPHIDRKSHVPCLQRQQVYCRYSYVRNHTVCSFSFVRTLSAEAFPRAGSGRIFFEAADRYRADYPPSTNVTVMVVSTSTGSPFN